MTGSLLLAWNWLAVAAWVAVVAALVAAVRIWRDRIEPQGDGGESPTRLAVHEVAYLAGGEARAANTAMVALLARGVCSFDPVERTLSPAAEGGEQARDSSEEAMLQLLDGHAAHVCRLRARFHVPEEVKRDLGRRGLLLPDPPPPSVRRPAAVPHAVVAALCLAGVAAQGRVSTSMVVVTLVALVLSIAFLKGWAASGGTSRRARDQLDRLRATEAGAHRELDDVMGFALEERGAPAFLLDGVSGRHPHPPCRACGCSCAPDHTECIGCGVLDKNSIGE